MSLTKEDLQAMRNVLQPEFNALNKAIEDLARELIKFASDLYL